MEEKKQYREASDNELLLDISLHLNDVKALLHTQIVAQARILAHLTSTPVETVRAELMENANREKSQSLEFLLDQYQLSEAPAGPASGQPE